MITRDDIIKARSVTIHQVLGIPNTGRRIALKCPLDGHNDRTASFVLYPDGSYNCYGCSANGQNSIDFCMDMCHNFSESIKYLHSV